MSWLLAAALLGGWLPSRAEAKGYSSGGGHSYSSSSSHSSSSGGSHSFSSGSHSFSSGGTSTHSSGGGSTHTFSSGSSSSHSSPPASSGSKSFSSGGGKSYSSGSTWSDEGRHSYTSGKSYGSGSGHTFTPGSSGGSAAPAPASPPRKPDSAPLKSYSSGGGHTFSSGSDSSASAPSATRKAAPDAGGSQFAFDSAAARAKKEQTSKAEFGRFKDSQAPPPGAPTAGSSSYRVQPPPIPSSGGGYGRTPVYIPDARTLSTRPVRIYNVFNPYYSRPVVYYHDPYNSFFWWWLLDRSLDDRAYWAYHHRYDMDPARYQALVANDQQLEARVQQLEAQQVARDPNYVPPDLAQDRDLMYSDRYVAHTYSNRPTRSGSLAFWVLAAPTALAVCAFFIWLIWFKRWQTAT